MDEIVTVETFIEHLTYYLKLAIYINKGTNKDAILEKCIFLYNRYKSIGNAHLSNEANVFIRKCFKRFNLVLKVTETGLPIDISIKSNQLGMIAFTPHSSIETNDMQSMIDYATSHNVHVLSDVPLTFILRPSKYRELLWQYTRSLFYISQLLVARLSSNIDCTPITNNAARSLETILVTISTLEEKLEVNNLMKADSFLNGKLVDTKIPTNNVNEAKEEIKKMFSGKGLSENTSMDKIIDSISDKLSDINLADGNIFESIYGIAQNVVQEIKGDFENDPQNLQHTLKVVTEALQDTVNDSNNGLQLPAELKESFDLLVNNMCAAGEEEQVTLNEIIQNRQTICANNEVLD